jgi:trans-aconitate 2-methyltransferase
MTEDWNARQYLKFEDERTRPPRDLLAQVPLEAPRRVFDLGCGPGNSTELLIDRYPQAEVVGLDSSPDMLRQARERLPGRAFLAADLAHWRPQEGTDLLFANAVLQWVPDHPMVLQRLLGIARGRRIGVQMPTTAERARAQGARAASVRRPRSQPRRLRATTCWRWLVITTGAAALYAPRHGTPSTTT